MDIPDKTAKAVGNVHEREVFCCGIPELFLTDRDWLWLYNQDLSTLAGKLAVDKSFPPLHPQANGAVER